MCSISIIGVPFNGGQPKSGVEKGPEELRKAGLVDAVKHAGWKVYLNLSLLVKHRREMLMEGLFGDFRRKKDFP